ncbi:hypothetical protein [Colwellia hornerae]|uniref:Transcription elongation factor n=1 Tax=Colwellia hornerae TaxID=89402 RepID=A0A5C6QBK8_9GAMM|nr:hypothetical protein [Colwellia hornerae]TWX51141.1 hypothetical protein ESZ28_14615 [Colwellia hornerae]TWX56817.1 hypothetical protein ESZ26_14580 [Colwellia hornerae]TWX66060.1 hypothetical protein ESZ27_11500 [Colwellia hornerae]
MMKKQKIINDILAYLSAELFAIKTAANNAHLAATDDQSVAETQYDTLAIEASYLAEGQSRRVHDIQQAEQAIEQFVIHDFDKKMPISLGALVQITQEKCGDKWFFIAPAAGGFRGVLNRKPYTVITPNSPMAMALMGKFIDDDVALLIGTNKQYHEVIAVY